MGNYWRKLARYVEDHVIIYQSIDLLDRVIKNRRLDTDRDVEMQRLEDILAKVRLHSAHTPWELIVQHTVSLSRLCVSDTFEKIVKEWTKNSTDIKVHHLMTLYALFVDVVDHHLQNNSSVNVLNEVRRLHYIIYHTLGTANLEIALRMIKC